MNERNDTTMHPKFRQVRAEVACAHIEAAAEALMESSHGAADNLERLGFVGATDVIDKAVADVLQHVRTIRVAVNLEAAGIRPGSDATDSA